MANQMSVEQEAACGVLYVIPDATMPVKALREMLRASRVEIVEAELSPHDLYESCRTVSGFSTY